MAYEIEINGEATVSKNILNGVGRLKWCARDEPIREGDTGWTFLSEVDNDEFCLNSENFVMVPYLDVFEIEPAVLWIFQLPIGTDIQLIIQKSERYFIDNNTGNRISI